MCCGWVFEGVGGGSHSPLLRTKLGSVPPAIKVLTVQLCRALCRVNALSSAPARPSSALLLRRR